MSSSCLETWRNPSAVDSFASRHYRDGHLEEPAFHDYPHARLTRHIAGILAKTAVRNGADIETDVLPQAAAYHDAGATLWHTIRHRFPIPEELAAHVAGRDLPALGMPEPQVESALEAIRETSRFVPCTSDTARCLSQADLMAGGILSHDVVLLHNTYTLYKESRDLAGAPTPSDPDELRGELLEFGNLSYEVLQAYLAEDLSLGPHQRTADGESTFNLRASRQVDRLLGPGRLAPILDVNLDYIINYQPGGQPISPAVV
jgi:hypothetical protein